MYDEFGETDRAITEFGVKLVDEKDLDSVDKAVGKMWEDGVLDDFYTEWLNGKYGSARDLMDILTRHPNGASDMVYGIEHEFLLYCMDNWSEVSAKVLKEE